MLGMLTRSQSTGLAFKAGLQIQHTGTKESSRNKEMKPIRETVPHSRLRLDGQNAAHYREARLMGIRPQ